MCKESIFRKRECHYAVFSYFIKVSRKYEFHNKIGLYFVSFATVCWIDVFTRHEYFDILASSIKYCREHKGMELCCYCFMPSHCHFLRSAKEQPMELLRNYKKFTSKKVIETIENNPQESRKKWLLYMYKRAGQNKSNVNTYLFWQHHNKTIEL